MKGPNSNITRSTPHLTEAQLRSYQKGRLSSAEMHNIEMHLLDCELCSDAIEGHDLLTEHEMSSSLHELKGRLATVLDEDKKNKPGWSTWAIAASLLLAMSLAVYFFVNQSVPSQESSLAKEEHEFKDEKISRDTPVESAPSVEAEQSHPTSQTEVPGQVSRPLTQKPKKKEELGSNLDKSAEPVPFVPEDNEMITLNDEPSYPITSNTDEKGAKDKDIAETPNPEAEGTDVVASNSRNKDLKLGTERKSEVPVNIVRGKIVGEDGKGIPGVSVVVKGTRIGTVTNIDGNYELSVPSSDAILELSFIGYASKEISTKGSNTPINAELTPDLAALSEVVVVGYSTEGVTETGDGKVITARPKVGMREFKKYIKENTKYTEEAKNKNIEGKVVVEFYVNPDGSTSGFKVKKSLGHGLDEEAIRLIKEGPSWEAGMYNGQHIQEQIAVKIPFKLK